MRYRLCKTCEKVLSREKQPNEKILYCSNKCKSIADGTYENHNSGLDLNTHTKGAIGELIVAVDLMKKGWYLFRALSPSSPCDLIAVRGNTIIRIEVRTGYKNKGGQLTFVRNKTDTGKSEHYAVILHKDNQILYLPDLPEEDN